MDVSFKDINGNHAGVYLNNMTSFDVADLDSTRINLKSGDLIKCRDLVRREWNLPGLRLILPYLGSLPFALAAFSDLLFKNLHSCTTPASPPLPPSTLHLFDQMREQNIVSYSTFIFSHSRHRRHTLALCLFLRISPDLPRFDRFTLIGVATACAGLEDLKSLKQLHEGVILNGLEMNLIIGNVFVIGYRKCGDAEFAWKVFDGVGERDVVSWMSLVGRYAGAGRLAEARIVFDEMPG
nr:pentatricopeptide repeat protein AaPPR645 [Agave angustifolia]